MPGEESRKPAGRKTAHWHGCVRCHNAYEDNCAAKTEDNLCVECRGGRGFQLLIDNRQPRDCCRTQSRLVTKDQKKSYRLEGSRLWFICTVCARTQPYNPQRTDGS